MTTAEVQSPYFHRDNLDTRKRTLEHLSEDMRRFSPDASSSEFSKLFHAACVVLELTDVELARLLRVSRPTISRWARNESAPHPFIRNQIFNLLADKAGERISALSRPRRAKAVLTP